jgi:hypothetical protein
MRFQKHSNTHTHTHTHTNTDREWERGAEEEEAAKTGDEEGCGERGCGCAMCVADSES